MQLSDIWWVDGMRAAYQIAAENSKKSPAKGNKQYNRGVRGATLTGVLVKNLSEREGPGKVACLLGESSVLRGGKSG